ncbi:hypothetical protein LTS17_007631 [Exophiala oligosperma]
MKHRWRAEDDPRDRDLNRSRERTKEHAAGVVRVESGNEIRRNPAVENRLFLPPVQQTLNIRTHSIRGPSKTDLPEFAISLQTDTLSADVPRAHRLHPVTDSVQTVGILVAAEIVQISTIGVLDQGLPSDHPTHPGLIQGLVGTTRTSEVPENRVLIEDKIGDRFHLATRREHPHLAVTTTPVIVKHPTKISDLQNDLENLEVGVFL